MNFSTLKALAIPEGDVVKIESSGVALWEMPSSYKNWVRYSTESDGTTIYNGGLGYKENYRIRSGGAEAGTTDTVITGFIPFKLGDVLRIYPPFTGQNTSNTLNFYNASFTHLGQITDSGSRYGICTTAYDSVVADGVSKLTYLDSFDSSIAYVRVGNQLSKMDNSGANFIVTINEEITD